MASAKGCFKTGCLGCLGSIAVIILAIGSVSLVAWNDSRNTQPVDTVLAPEEAATAPDPAFYRLGGVVRLELSEGEFSIFPADHGEGLRVEAVYDDAMHDLDQNFVVGQDSTWEYSLEFKQTQSGLRAMMRSIFAKGPSPRLRIFLPQDIPMDLITDISQGGLEAELGGLRLRNANMELDMGGLELSVSRPLAHPMTSMHIRTNMGGLDGVDLGNASPRELAINCKLGGGQIGLEGAWMNDCLVSLSVDMGGLSVEMPADVEVHDGWPTGEMEGGGEISDDLPVIYLKKSETHGEIEVEK